jgi:cobalt-zinc-cadmium efflux system membrane fusion protein
VVDEQTRTATARVVLPNPEGTWRPGLFVTGTVTVDSADVPVLILQNAVQTLGGETVVFVLDSDGLEPRPVRLGRANGHRVEILAGLSAGDRFVSRGGFALKSELEKAGFEAGHAH